MKTWAIAWDTTTITDKNGLYLTHRDHWLKCRLALACPSLLCLFFFQFITMIFVVVSILFLFIDHFELVCNKATSNAYIKMCMYYLWVVFRRPVIISLFIFPFNTHTSIILLLYIAAHTIYIVVFVNGNKQNQVLDEFECFVHWGFNSKYHFNNGCSTIYKCTLST